MCAHCEQGRKRGGSDSAGSSSRLTLNSKFTVTTEPWENNLEVSKRVEDSAIGSLDNRRMAVADEDVCVIRDIQHTECKYAVAVQALEKTAAGDSRSGAGPPHSSTAFCSGV